MLNYTCNGIIELQFIQNAAEKLAIIKTIINSNAVFIIAQTTIIN
jgi:hypothetical protein